MPFFYRLAVAKLPAERVVEKKHVPKAHPAVGAQGAEVRGFGARVNFLKGNQLDQRRPAGRHLWGAEGA